MNTELIAVLAGILRHSIAAAGVAGYIKSESWYGEAASLLVAIGAAVWSAVKNRKSAVVKQDLETQLIKKSE